MATASQQRSFCKQYTHFLFRIVYSLLCCIKYLIISIDLNFHTYFRCYANNIWLILKNQITYINLVIYDQIFQKALQVWSPDQPDLYVDIRKWYLVVKWMIDWKLFYVPLASTPLMEDLTITGQKLIIVKQRYVFIAPYLQWPVSRLYCFMISTPLSTR